MTRILVIDDDQAVRQATKILLDANGFDVVTVAGGKAGIDEIKVGSFDVVIVDLFMPGMDGLKTTEAIRRYNAKIPIIAASGFMFGGVCPPMPNFDRMAKEAGAVLTLYKPFRPQELLKMIKDAIGPQGIEAPRQC
jgi:CheY-like chemotaxis protein